MTFYKKDHACFRIERGCEHEVHGYCQYDDTCLTKVKLDKMKERFEVEFNSDA